MPDTAPHQLRKLPHPVYHGTWQYVWWRWTRAVTLGELVGFAVPALVGTLISVSGLPEGHLTRLLLVIAGAGEGAVLGAFQYYALRRCLPRLSPAAWIAGTALAAALAWAIGLIPSSLAAPPQLSPAAMWIAGILGLTFLLSIGGVQWLELRRHVERAGWWIVANAVAWPLGIAVPVAALSMLPDGTPAIVLAAVGLASGALMGVVVGALTGLVLVRLLDSA